MKIPDYVQRELRHYFKYEDFGPSSPCLEILSFGTYELKEPEFPRNSDARIMMRVRPILFMAEGHEVDSIRLPEAQSMPTVYPIYKRVFNETERYSFLEFVSKAKPGAMPILSAYYGRYGLGATLADGTVHDNTKGTSESPHAIVAVYPLTGEPMTCRSCQRAIDKISEMIQDKRTSVGLRTKLWNQIDRKANEMLDEAHAAYINARTALYGE